jgi:hypothetical protein
LRFPRAHLRRGWEKASGCGDVIAAPAEQVDDMMAIYPLFSDQAFGPEKLERMAGAYESVCKTLGLSLTNDMVTQAVAEKIIEYAQRGVDDAAALSAKTLQAFNHRELR